MHNRGTMRPISGRGKEIRHHVANDITNSTVDIGGRKGSGRHGYLLIDLHTVVNAVGDFSQRHLNHRHSFHRPVEYSAAHVDCIATAGCAGVRT
jgi:hypothetical protein